MDIAGQQNLTQLLFSALDSFFGCYDPLEGTTNMLA